MNWEEVVADAQRKTVAQSPVPTWIVETDYDEYMALTCTLDDLVYMGWQYAQIYSVVLPNGAVLRVG